MRGNITAPRVILEDGSSFKGSVDMDPKEPSKKPEDIPDPLLERQFEKGAENAADAVPTTNIAEM